MALSAVMSRPVIVLILYCFLKDYSCIFNNVFCAVERKTDAVDTNSLQVTATDDISTGRQQHSAVGEMIRQYLYYQVNIKRGNLVDKLVTKNIISPSQRERVRKEKKTDAKVGILLRMLREKSADEFERFLATLRETGQQTVALIVSQALDALGQAGQNPLQHHLYGKPVYFLISLIHLMGIRRTVYP